MKQSHFEYLLVILLGCLIAFIISQLIILYPRSVEITSANRIGNSYYLSIRNNNYRPLIGYLRVSSDIGYNGIIPFKLNSRDINKVLIGDVSTGSIINVIDYDGNEWVFDFS
ncbi:hypothetical protein TCON_0900 [Astathelohania contejeani]|uniref:Uncharacterized protein n=1 Tax=Astathelohania contejeani TaxID=164912 RepID=A0ABQ7I0H0_9MICR|nr:hypothetical protein TCON_0900 [Thelohania contejeani]